jgi:hypothetical protein
VRKTARLVEVVDSATVEARRLMSSLITWSVISSVQYSEIQFIERLHRKLRHFASLSLFLLRF